MHATRHPQADNALIFHGPGGPELTVDAGLLGACRRSVFYHAVGKPGRTGHDRAAVHAAAEQGLSV